MFLCIPIGKLGRFKIHHMVRKSAGNQKTNCKINSVTLDLSRNSMFRGSLKRIFAPCKPANLAAYIDDAFE